MEEKGGKVGLQMSIHLLYTESNNMGFTYQKSILSLLLAQPYCIQKVLHEGRSVHIIKPKNKKQKKTIHKNQYFFLKYQEKKRKYTYKKVLYNVDKTAQNCYKKGRRTLWSRTILLRILHLTVIFFFSVYATDAEFKPPSGRALLTVVQ